MSLREKTIIQLSSENVEVVRMYFKDGALYSKETIKQLPVGTFFSTLFSEGGDNSALLTALKDGVVVGTTDSFHEGIGKEAVLAFIQEVLSSTDEKFEELVEADKQKALEQADKTAKKVFERALKAVFKEYKTKITEEGHTALLSILDEYKSKLLKIVSKKVGGYVSGSYNFIPVNEVLPSGTKFACKKGEYTILVIEQQPAVRSVRVGERLGGTPKVPFSVALPFVIFTLVLKKGSLHQLYVNYSNTPIRSLDNSLHACNLPNTYGDFRGELSTSQRSRVCTGTISRSKKETQSTGEFVEEVIDDYWGATYNGDLTEQFIQYGRLHKKIASFKNWEAATKADPQFILKIKWQKLEPIKVFLDKILSSINATGTEEAAKQIEASFTHSSEDLKSTLLKHLSGITVEVPYDDVLSDAWENREEALLNSCFELLVAAFKAVASDNDAAEQNYVKLIELLKNQFNASIEATFSEVMTGLPSQQGSSFNVDNLIQRINAV